ncbi:MAG TPA: hypothetical protein VGA95_04240, partial [Thermodesulfobacteriota bacterium]
SLDPPIDSGITTQTWLPKPCHIEPTQHVISNLVLSFREGTVRDLVVKSVDTKTKERFLLAVEIARTSTCP